ncbi:CHAD domain-containing protein [Amycolatopsis thermophila]|uniref:CHAD domain-containing protein n=1 Tax=Amycolatopsis thermophila TaxID=206084 RepID=A0ABU0EPR9_9PSEU|nr:CHAD domain-containing protein [Amycolatopsis thermophila]MDQ0377285.1 CHAD domain-containing protein [Amycolatopsis thermophila]
MSTATLPSRVLTVGDLGLPGTPLAAGRGDTPEALLRARIDGQLRALLAYEPGTRSGADPEDLHQMRVAVRRLRSALKLLGPAGDDVRAELKWLGAALGEVRDHDVLIGHLRATVASFEAADQPAGARLVRIFVAERAKAKRRLNRCLGSSRYTALLRSAARLVLTELPLATADGPVVVDVAALIRKPYRKLVKAVAALPADPPDDELHELRIYGKRLRYAAETAKSAARKKEIAQVKSLIKATRQLQDVLGDHQDAVVAAARMRELVATADEAAVGFVAGRIAERELRRRATARAAWPAALSTLDAAAGKLCR